MEAREEDDIPLLDVTRVEDEEERELEYHGPDEHEEAEEEEEEEDDEDEEDKEEVDLTPEMGQLMLMMKMMDRQHRKRYERQQRKMRQLLERQQEQHTQTLKALRPNNPVDSSIPPPRRIEVDQTVAEYLVGFEKLMKGRGTPRRKWPAILPSLLDRKYNQALSLLDEEETDNYDIVKETLLAVDVEDLLLAPRRFFEAQKKQGGGGLSQVLPEARGIGQAHHKRLGRVKGRQEDETEIHDGEIHHFSPTPMCYGYQREKARNHQRCDQLCRRVLCFKTVEHNQVSGTRKVGRLTRTRRSEMGRRT